MTPRVRAALRATVSVGLLAGLAVLLDARDVAARIADLRPEWVALALLLSVAQACLLAWRWRFTAGRLGIELPFPTALREYYLGNFLNQVLPGGVTGDLSRAFRHARTEAPTGPAVRAVVLERLSGQLVMTSVALVSIALVPGLPEAARAGGGGVLAAIVTALLLTRLRRSESAGGSNAFDRLRADARTAVLEDGALPVHLGTGVLTVASYVGIYLIAARAVGIGTPVPILAPLVAPVLMTMLIPVTVAGWGVREAAAAMLWAAVGLGPEDGVAISVAYGGLVLLSTLPGALVLSGVRVGDPDRRGRRLRAGSDAPEGAARRSGSGSEPA